MERDCIVTDTLSSLKQIGKCNYFNICNNCFRNMLFKAKHKKTNQTKPNKIQTNNTQHKYK